MNVILKTIVLVFCFRVSAIELLKRSELNEGENGTGWLPEEEAVDQESNGDQMNSTVYMSVNHYYCATEEVEDPDMILYGTKSWTFPAQDVNLTLSYPTANSDTELLSSEEDGYVITGFKVVLYIDGMESKGYIVGGGIKQENITLSFVSHNITSLSYQFWLYGVPKSTSGMFLNKLNYLCH